MTDHNQGIIIEQRQTKNGGRVLVVPAGKVQAGDTILRRQELVADAATAANCPGFVDSGRVAGNGRTIWEKTERLTVASVGAPFRFRGYYVDEEDSLSAGGAHKARQVMSQQAQYAYLAD